MSTDTDRLNEECEQMSARIQVLQAESDAFRRERDAADARLAAFDACGHDVRTAMDQVIAANRKRDEMQTRAIRAESDLEVAESFKTRHSRRADKAEAENTRLLAGREAVAARPVPEGRALAISTAAMMHAIDCGLVTESEATEAQEWIKAAAARIATLEAERAEMEAEHERFAERVAEDTGRLAGQLNIERERARVAELRVCGLEQDIRGRIIEHIDAALATRAAAQSAPSGLDESVPAPGFVRVSDHRYERTEAWAHTLGGTHRIYAAESAPAVAAATARLTAEVAALRERLYDARREWATSNAMLEEFEHYGRRANAHAIYVEACRLFGADEAARLFPRGPAAVKGATTDGE